MGISTAALALGDVLEIFLRSDVKLRRLGEIGERLGKTLCPCVR
jgi:hypothetical protein